MDLNEKTHSKLATATKSVKVVEAAKVQNVAKKVKLEKASRKSVCLNRHGQVIPGQLSTRNGVQNSVLPFPGSLPLAWRCLPRVGDCLTRAWVNHQDALF